MPAEVYDTDFPFTTSPSLPSSAAVAVPTPATKARQGSISITANPSLRHSTADLAFARRDSLATSRNSTATITPSALDASALSRKDSLSGPKFHIPPITSLVTAPQRTPSFYAAGGRSLDARSVNGDGPGSRNGSLNGDGPKRNGFTNGNGNGNGLDSNTKSGAPERKGSVLGRSGFWKRKASTASLLPDALEE